MTTLCICRLLEERVLRLKTMLTVVQSGKILSVDDQKMLDAVNEDLHWLLLITGLHSVLTIVSKCAGK